MIAAQETGIALVGGRTPSAAASAGVPGSMTPPVDAGAGSLQTVAADAVKKTSLRKRLFGCLKAKRLKVLAGKPSALHQDQGMDMPVGRVVIVDGGDKLHGFAQALFKLEHGVKGEVS